MPEAVGCLVRSALRRPGRVRRTAFKRVRSGPSGDACIVGVATDLRWVNARLAAAAASRLGGKQMCFLCARLAADGWRHIVDVLAIDPQVKAHMCFRFVKLAGADDRTRRWSM